MDTIGRIRELGFRKWYERQLYWGHFFLLVCVGGLLLLTAAIEIYVGHAGKAELATALVLGLVGVVATGLGWGRYRRVMLVAEYLGNHATCDRCQTYGRFEVTAAGAALQQTPVDLQRAEELWLRVHCRKCGNDWQI